MEKILKVLRLRILIKESDTNVVNVELCVKDVSLIRYGLLKGETY